MKKTSAIISVIIVLSACSKKESVDDLIQKSEISKGHTVLKTEVLRQTEDINHIKTVYYKVTNGKNEILVDSIRISSTGDGLLSEVAW